MMVIEMDNVMVSDDPVQLKQRIAELEEQLAAARADAANEFVRGFDRAFAMGVNSFSALWSEVVKSISPAHHMLEGLNNFADDHLNAVDGRNAEERGGGTLADAPIDAWDRYDRGMSAAERNAALAESPAVELQRQGGLGIDPSEDPRTDNIKPKRQSRKRS
jgi:hypothetical protein